jgi:amidase/aspartyl-tRNA(Asn)/glutamyl-tRNA(Gln) amidotransferase subunit A
MSFSQHIAEQGSRIRRHRQERGVAILDERIDAAQLQAAAWDTLAQSGVVPPLAGLSVAVKACFDVQGWSTTAGSRVLADQPPARADAPLVAALKQSGAVVTAQTNMTEFAFGALGTNPHFGTPVTPLDPSGQRIAGGSTSGGAVAVALGLADLALGSDTSGSVRIPAAFCGVTGFKPSRGRYSDGGMIFLSRSFDVPGFIARDVETLLRVDRALQPHEPVMPGRVSLRGSRFLIPTHVALEHADPLVVAAFQAALKTLRSQGAELVEEAWPELAHYGEVAVEGGIIIAEAFAWHQSLLLAHPERYDPRTGPRIALGEQVKASAYLNARQALARHAIEFHKRLASFDALLMPTVPILPPRLAELEDDAVYYKTNRLAFRLTEVANRIDAPSVSLPMDSSQPMGICLTGHRGGDRRLLQLSAEVQNALQPFSFEPTRSIS